MNSFSCPLSRNDINELSYHVINHNFGIKMAGKFHVIKILENDTAEESYLGRMIPCQITTQ